MKTKYRIVEENEVAKVLAERILRYKRAYYCPHHPEVKQADIVSDVLYDDCEDRLRRIDPNHPVLSMVGYLD